MTKSISSPFSVSITQAQSGFPTWRQNKTKDTGYTIANTVNMSDIQLPPPSSESPPFNGIIDAWGAFANDDATIYSSLGGGHGRDKSDPADWQNAVLKIDLTQQAPAWSIVDPGSVYADTTIHRRYADGRPCSRHLYYALTFVSGAHTYDGKARIFHPECQYGWAEDADATWLKWDGGPRYASGPEVEAFRVADAASGAAAWDGLTAWTPYPGFSDGNVAAVCTDTRSGKVYVSSNGMGYSFEASVGPHGSWTLLTSGGMAAVEFCGSTIDTVNDQVVWVCPGRHDNVSQTPRLLRMPINSPYTFTTTTLSGYSGFASGLNLDEAALVYDTDNNRFLLVRNNNDGNGFGDAPMVAIAQDGTCTELTNAVIPHSRGDNAPLGRLCYLPTFHCVIYASRFSNDLHFIPTV